MSGRKYNGNRARFARTELLSASSSPLLFWSIRLKIHAHGVRFALFRMIRFKFSFGTKNSTFHTIVESLDSFYFRQSPFNPFEPNPSKIRDPLSRVSLLWEGGWRGAAFAFPQETDCRSVSRINIHTLYVLVLFDEQKKKLILLIHFKKLIPLPWKISNARPCPLPSIVSRPF